VSNVIDLGSRLKAAFGYVANNESAALRKQQFAKDNGIADAGIYMNSASFEQITIKKNDVEKLVFGSMMTTPTGLQIFAPPPMVSFTKGKKLVITEIDGSDAEVVERYGNKSTEINIQGLLVDMVNHQYPKTEVKTLNEFFEYTAPYAVEAEIFDDLNIKSIYFIDFNIGGVAGYADTIQYTLSARSIRPVEFFFVKNNN